MTIVEEIKKLKEEKDAVILAHYYVRPEVQEIADYIGDSFYLSKVATKLKEQTIVFCVVSSCTVYLLPDLHSFYQGGTNSLWSCIFIPIFTSPLLPHVPCPTSSVLPHKNHPKQT